MKSRNLDQYIELHQQRVYGNTGVKMSAFLNPWIRQVRPRTLLDYGAGRGGLVHAVDAPEGAIRHQFDPAIPGIDHIPLKSYDLVFCTDVLEHLDQSEISAILDEIRVLSRHAILIVGTAPARAVLPNGENAHATVQPAEWWLAEVRKCFSEAQKIPVFRRNRVGIKTWLSSPMQFATATASVLAAAARRKMAGGPKSSERAADQ